MNFVQEIKKDDVGNSWAALPVMLKRGKIKRTRTRAWRESVCFCLE